MQKVNVTPFISRDPESIASTIRNELTDHAQRINTTIVNDGEEHMLAPLVLASYAKAALPDAATWINGLIIVSDETGGLTVAFSDGSNWRRVQDRAVVS